MKTTVNGIGVNYMLEGPANAPVVTMSHSLATDLSMWEPQLPVLTSRYRVLRYDTRGHGGTEATDGPSPEDYWSVRVRRVSESRGQHSPWKAAG